MFKVNNKDTRTTPLLLECQIRLIKYTNAINETKFLYEMIYSCQILWNSKGKNKVENKIKKVEINTNILESLPFSFNKLHSD